MDSSLFDMQNICLAGILLCIASASARKQDYPRDRQQFRRHDICAHYATIYVCTVGDGTSPKRSLRFSSDTTLKSIISRFESEERAITLAVAIACQTIFAVEPREVFPALFASVEQSIVQHMYELRDQLAQSELTQKTVAKLELLQEALRRIEGASEQQGI